MIHLGLGKHSPAVWRLGEERRLKRHHSAARLGVPAQQLSSAARIKSASSLYQLSSSVALFRVPARQGAARLLGICASREPAQPDRSWSRQEYEGKEWAITPTKSVGVP